MTHLSRSLCLSLALIACGGGDTDDDPSNGDGSGSSPSTLFDVQNVPSGDDCPSGGVRFLVGLDDGAGDGDAGDGELHPDEVRNEDLVCFPEPPVTDPPDDPDAPPAGAIGTAQIDLSGGDGAEGGGRGGNLTVEARSNGVAKTYIDRTGASRAGQIAVPPPGGLGYGPVPYTVTGNVTVPRMSDCSGIADEALCQVSQGNVLYVKRGDELLVVTGLRVEPGATLTLPGGSGGGGPIFLVQLVIPAGGADARFTHDLSIAGTVRTEGDVGLELRARTIDIDATGVVTTAATGPGNDGGQLRLNADRGGGGLLVSRGTLDASGADGPEGGGSGGSISLTGSFGARVAGTVRSRGGNDASSAGFGGRGGNVNLGSDVLPGVFAGEIDVRGGHGARGGNVSIGGGVVDVSGVIDARGGAAKSGCTSRCDGGEGGGVELFSLLGQVRFGANLRAGGGAGAGTWGFGGSGGYLVSYDGSEGGYGGPQLAADIEFGGEVDLRGGSGRFGGPGGNVYVNTQREQADAVVRFVGVPEILARGGDGDDGYGARGGRLTIGSGGVMLTRGGGSSASSAGDLFLRTDVSVGGGDGGGRGGEVYVGAGLERAVLRGDFDASGGDSTSRGGRGGELLIGEFFAAPDADVEGAFTARGGDGAEGGHGGAIVLGGLLGQTRAVVDIEVGGGSGSFLGGDGGEGNVFGAHCFARGTADAKGGDGGDFGGEGGRLTFISTDGAGDIQFSATSAAGGAGTTPGEPGRCSIDGVSCP